MFDRLLIATRGKMERWSFVKRFGRITFDDFMRLAPQFCNAIDSCYESPSRVTITFYKKPPHSITTIEPELDKWLAERNKEGELAKVNGLENVTRDLFDQAVNIQLKIRPEDDTRAPRYTFGHMECKGLLRRHVVCYVQPEEVGSLVKTLLLGEQRPPRLKFGVGHGFECCHSLSLR